MCQHYGYAVTEAERCVSVLTEPDHAHEHQLSHHDEVQSVEHDGRTSRHSVCKMLCLMVHYVAQLSRWCNSSSPFPIPFVTSRIMLQPRLRAHLVALIQLFRSLLELLFASWLAKSFSVHKYWTRISLMVGNGCFLLGRVLRLALDCFGEVCQERMSKCQVEAAKYEISYPWRTYLVA